MQHSQAAAASFRQQVYAAHNSNGKAQIWFTFSPDDAQSFKIVWYALGPHEATTWEKQTPSGEFRFGLLARHPVAAALHFERILKIVVQRVIGWDMRTRKPFKSGGLFGIAKAWLRIVEEQSRLTLYAHFLIWLYGHCNFENQILNLKKLLKEMECEFENYEGKTIIRFFNTICSFKLTLFPTRAQFRQLYPLLKITSEKQNKNQKCQI